MYIKFSQGRRRYPETVLRLTEAAASGFGVQVLGLTHRLRTTRGHMYDAKLITRDFTRTSRAFPAIKSSMAQIKFLLATEITTRLVPATTNTTRLEVIENNV